MQEVLELVAAAHVADRHEVGSDRADQLFERGRLADDAQADQSIHAGWTAAVLWTAESGTFNELELDSVRDARSKIHRRGRRHQGVKFTRGADGRRASAQKIIGPSRTCHVAGPDPV